MRPTRLLRASSEGHDGGNTLVELLIVATVIAILAAIAIPVYLTQRGTSVEASMKSDLRSVATLMETHYVDHRAYPADLATLENGDVEIYVSRDTSLYLEVVDGRHFCLRAENPGASAPIRYDNGAGGVLGVDEPCA